MALESRSVDEETTELADVYDRFIAPHKIWRNHNNKLYLTLRAYAAGKVGLNDAAIALRNRYNPLYCDDIDLYSTAKLVGTDFKQGTGSLVRITICNTNITEPKLFKAGVYNYASVSGMLFYFEQADDYAFGPEESRTVTAASREKGGFPVGDGNNIHLFRADSAAIDGAFTFSCADNAGQLGYLDETPFDFRTRILHDAFRQDHIRELELKIRNLPNIFECNLIINEGTEPQAYDGILLEPKELLIMLTGAPTDAVAKLVAEDVLYSTHIVDPNLVVYYHDDHYINGRYPVYYKPHDSTPFSLAVTYQYDQDKLKSTQVEDAVTELFKPYTRMVTHLDTFSEEDAYKVLSALNLPNVKILNADIINADGAAVPYVRIPKTRLPCLTGIAFTAVELGDVV
jgi:hypothetical protein